jgi:hypothetical protein
LIDHATINKKVKIKVGQEVFYQTKELLLALICILFSILIPVPQIRTNNSIMVPVLKVGPL